MTEWSEHVPTSGSVHLPPDPRVMDAMGRNHSLQTALADLVDNSIDAGASHVLIQFIRSGGKLRSLHVMDNGKGMSPEQIDTAMTIGGERTYGSSDLGHFGLGLKAASFSQARSLTVVSRKSGCAAVGRRWHLDRAKDDYSCDHVSDEFATALIDADWDVPITGTGTVVRWDDVRGFPSTADSDRVEKYITHTTTDILNHLGLVFHRFIERGQIHIAVEFRDVELDGLAPRTDVTPINPFDYRVSGRPDFPKDIRATTGHDITFRCYVWPPRSIRPEFKLPAGAERSQGWYFYRNDRLLEAGAGWTGTGTPEQRHLQLARVAVDIDNAPADLFQMNPEKSKVVIGLGFAEICEAARAADGTTLADYLAIAEDVYRKARKPSRARKRMIHPGQGFPPGLRKAIKNEIPALNEHEAIDIRWRTFTDDAFFAVDRDEMTLWLNKRYRKMLLGGKHGGLNDLPLIKTLLYLLMENIFEGERFGARDKDNLDLWQELLTIAVRAERQ
jgi:hypothetical protein